MRGAGEVLTTLRDNHAASHSVSPVSSIDRWITQSTMDELRSPAYRPCFICLTSLQGYVTMTVRHSSRYGSSNRGRPTLWRQEEIG